MEPKLDIYTPKRGKKVRREILIPEPPNRMLSELSVITGRSVTDLILEGISIVIEGYKDLLTRQLDEKGGKK